jgi:predicted AAA+ superfamily ATPase
MLPRRLGARLNHLLTHSPAVVLLGPRQVGKTTLALEIGEKRPSVYLDLEDNTDRVKLSDPVRYFADHERDLVILDEVHRLPELFQCLRGVIDRGRRRGKPNGQFLLLGSAAIDLLKQSGESLAGRISYLELGPFDPLEVASAKLETLWVRGGFPRSFLADSDELSLAWRRDFIRTYLERDIPQFGSRIPAETLRRFWTMLAHNQSQLLNAASLASGLGVDGKTVASYLDLLVDLLLVRRLPAWHRNVGKRLVKSPKVYVRDSGLAHACWAFGTRNLCWVIPSSDRRGKASSSKRSLPPRQTELRRIFIARPPAMKLISFLPCRAANCGPLKSSEVPRRVWNAAFTWPALTSSRTNASSSIRAPNVSRSMPTPMRLDSATWDGHCRRQNNE